MLLLRRWNRFARTRGFEVVYARVGGDVARSSIDTAAIARRRTTEIEPFDGRSRARHQGMRPVDAQLVRYVGTDAHGALSHVRVELFDVERREQVGPDQIVAFDIGRIDTPV